MCGVADERFEKADALKNMLVSRATGGFVIPEKYRELRTELMADTVVRAKLPRFIRTCRSMDEFWGFIQPKFAHYHERRAYIRKQFDPLLTMLEEETMAPVNKGTSAILSTVDSIHVRQVWDRALERRTSDPEGAITLARTLLESVCKHILDKKHIVYEENDDLPKLYRKAAEQLNLAPSQHTQKVFRQILGGCFSVVQGLGTLRNRLGDAHGKGRGAVRPRARHAELAVNLAGSTATFLVVTLEEQRDK